MDGWTVLLLSVRTPAHVNVAFGRLDRRCFSDRAEPRGQDRRTRHGVPCRAFVAGILSFDRVAVSTLSTANRTDPSTQFRRFIIPCLLFSPSLLRARIPFPAAPAKLTSQEGLEQASPHEASFWFFRFFFFQVAGPLGGRHKTPPCPARLNLSATEWHNGQNGRRAVAGRSELGLFLESGRRVGDLRRGEGV